MANFKTHITFSTLMGAGYGGVAYGLFDVPLGTSLLAGGMCGVSGMLPDVDSDAGVPLRESMAFAAAVVPMMMIDRYQQFGLSCEWMVLAGAATYLFIRFVVARFLRRYTVHRGMFHSLPAAVVFGELAFHCCNCFGSCQLPQSRSCQKAVGLVAAARHCDKQRREFLVVGGMERSDRHRGVLLVDQDSGEVVVCAFCRIGSLGPAGQACQRGREQYCAPSGDEVRSWGFHS